jgi:hypothetical protein
MITEERPVSRLSSVPSLSNRQIVYAILGVAFAVFGYGIAGQFHLDDYTLFGDRAITSPSGWWRVWSPLQTRPLTYLTFWLNYQIGGRNPIGYHAVSIALHLLAVWLLWRTLDRLLSARAALIATAIFALHPIQAEPVNYIFERATVLATVFCLLSVKPWMEDRYWTAAGWFFLALLSKEECAAFPLILLMLKPVWLPAAGMLALSLAAGGRVIAALAVLGIGGAGPGTGIAPLDYLCTQGVVVLRYLRMLVLPYGFSIDPDPHLVRDWHGWAAWAAILLLAGLLWKFHPEGKWFAAGLVLLAPSSTIFPAADLAADRRLYLPMVALAAFAGLLLARLPRVPLLPVLIAGLGVLSLLRTEVWRTELALWSEAVEQAPTKVRALLHLARASDPAAAVDILDYAESLAPGNPELPEEKGTRFLEAGLPNLALREFDRELAMRPGYLPAMNNRGIALSLAGRRDEAVASFEQVLAIDPCWSSARSNLAKLGVTSKIRPCAQP